MQRDQSHKIGLTEKASEVKWLLMLLWNMIMTEQYANKAFSLKTFLEIKLFSRAIKVFLINLISVAQDDNLSSITRSILVKFT